MSEEKTAEGRTEQRPKITLSKKIVPFEESSPDSEPMFINYVQPSHAGGVAYLDVGIIPLDQILEHSIDATFLVLSRLVMSRETMIAMRDQITQLFESADAHVDITQNTPQI